MNFLNTIQLQLSFIRSDAFPTYCLDYMQSYKKPVQLYSCNNQNLTDASFSQNWRLNWYKKVFKRNSYNKMYNNFNLQFKLLLSCAISKILALLTRNI